MDRYQNLFTVLGEIAKYKTHLQYMEIGTYNGDRAVQLLKHWLGLPSSGGVRTASYWGFDLFENMTPERNRAELSKSRLPPAQAVVQGKLTAVGASVRLFKGDTRVSLPAFVTREKPPLDLIFQDGGHSLETVESDWAAASTLLKPSTIYLFDDYYENRQDVGCKLLVNRLQEDPAYRVTLLDPKDFYVHTDLHIRMVRVTRA